MSGTVATIRGDRAPLCCPEAEAAVLSTLILEPHRFAEVAQVVQPHHFFTTSNRRVFQAIEELATTKRGVDVVNVALVLREQGRLEEIGGTPYLGELVDATPAVANVLDHAATVAEFARLRLIAREAEALAVHARNGEPLEALSERIKRLSEVSEAKKTAAPSLLRERWVRFADDSALLRSEPPAQTWLLKQVHRGRDVGVFPRGKTGLLTATGGVGKTYSLIDLAIAVATGSFWFGTFRVVTPGHVLLALAEEDLDEARRRLWRVCNSREFSAEERATLAERIDLLPLAGVSVALTSSPAPGIICPTPFASELKGLLEQRGVEWSLIILDPLSRWAGGGVEGDNEAATRFCQTIEALTSVPGKPSVLVAHHSSKTSAKDGAADARGVTGLRDGFRWQASLDPVKAEDGTQGVKLTNRKSNYSRMFEDVLLVRSEEPGCEGTLRAAQAWEAEKLLAARLVAADEYQARVLRTVRDNPGLTSKRQILERTSGGRTPLSQAIQELLDKGELLQTEDGFSERSSLEAK